MAYVDVLFALLMLGAWPASDERAVDSQPVETGLPQSVTGALTPIPPSLGQVRIEQRLIIRVPRQSISRSSLLPMPAPRQAPPLEPPRFERRKVGKCLAMRDVSGVRVINDDMLVLFMRDQRMIEAQLERTCSAREFYQGFYMERSGDGRLCVDRDLLQARSGSKCEVEKLRQLVPED
ncbi:MAG: hypothetical protein KYX66_11860 [Blastomonas fulva]|uniref:hypothetical protein n=1 Tax=Blastomonas fulva TaxID=1550728 RepID=UPI0024E24C5B|nr:hypothetical protein [Blastomonas fulva]MDK2757425.1 hypothetical protein [Blastomonas fulva]